MPVLADVTLWHDAARWRSFDTETPKFEPGRLAPPIVCSSVGRIVNGPSIVGALIVGRDRTIATFREYLETGHVLFFANAPYDLAVAAAADPTLLPLIFAALDENRIYDVSTAEVLNAIYHGTLGKMPDGSELRSPTTGKPCRYNLEVVTYLVLGRVDAKKNDQFRKSYSLLANFPEHVWPHESRTYPVDDAVNALEVAAEQIFGKPGRHAWVTQGELTVCRLCQKVLDYSSPVSEACPSAPREPHRNLGNLPAQVRSAFALHLGAAHSLRTDPERVAKLSVFVEEKYAAWQERFKGFGWIRAEDGSEDQRALKKSIVEAYGGLDGCPRCNGTGAVRRVQVVDCRGQKVKGRYRGCLGDSCPTCAGTRQLRKLGNEVTCKNEFDEDGALVESGCDGSGYDLSQVPNLPRSDKLGVKTDRDTLMESGNEHLAEYGEDEWKKSKSTYLPYLARGIHRPLSISANVLVATGRCSYEGCPVHQFPRSGFERECIRARGAWCGYPIEMVLGSTDYSAGELCLPASTRILTSKGYVPIRELCGSTVNVASRYSGEHTFVEAPAFHKAKVFSTGKKPTLRITTVDGRRLECTANHPVLVQDIYGSRNKKGVDYEWREAGRLRVGDVLVSGAVAINNEVPRLDSKYYALGHFLGDGWLTTREGSGSNNVGVCAGGTEKLLLEALLPVWEQIADEAEELFPSERKYEKRQPIQLRHVESHFTENVDEATKSESAGVVELRVRNHTQVAKLLQQRYGFAAVKAVDKRLPSSYWNASPDQKRSFLRGLFDADGSVVLKPRRSVSFTAANEELARDVMLALSEFGVEARMTTHELPERAEGRQQTILQVRGDQNFKAVAKHILFVDSTFRSCKAEKLANVTPKQIQNHRHGMTIKSIENAGVQEVFNLEVPRTRHYIAEGLVVHNCTLSQYTYWLFGKSKMRDAINDSGNPGILHSDLAAEVIGISLDDFLKRLKSKDKQAVDFRQMCKPINFGVPGGMGVPKLVYTSRKKNAGFTVCERGPARNEKDQPGYWGVRFCVLMGTEQECGIRKVTKWKDRDCPPVCEACLKVVDGVLKPAYLKRYPEIKEYFQWAKRMIDSSQPAPSLLYDRDRDEVVVVRERGGCDFPAFCNNGFQSMLSDIGKWAHYEVTRECYLGVKRDGSPSPLAGCRVPLYLHDEPLTELIAETAHLSGPRVAEIMVEAGERFAPDVVWKAETALAHIWNKAMEPAHNDDGKLIPWDSEEAIAKRKAS